MKFYNVCKAIEDFIEAVLDIETPSIISPTNHSNLCILLETFAKAFSVYIELVNSHNLRIPFSPGINGIYPQIWLVLEKDSLYWPYTDFYKDIENSEVNTFSEIICSAPYLHEVVAIGNPTPTDPFFFQENIPNMPSLKINEELDMSKRTHISQIQFVIT